jgi:hypothetical protein
MASAAKSGAGKGAPGDTAPQTAAPTDEVRSDESAGEPATDDVKRRFREALDRKNHKHAEGAAAGENGEHAKVHGAHGPAHTQRQFRRKSG